MFTLCYYAALKCILSRPPITSEVIGGLALGHRTREKSLFIT